MSGVRILNATLTHSMLSNNLITHVESLNFVPMMMLKILDLSKNLITKIEFKNTIWPSISCIIMDDNHLTFINIADHDGFIQKKTSRAHGGHVESS